MIVAVRRALAGLLLGLVVSFGVAGIAAAASPSAGPTASATASASASATTGADTAGSADTPDVAPDNSRQLIAIGAAGVVALITAAVVFLRRR
nr:hypothetical protein [Propionicimonas sp.]